MSHKPRTQGPKSRALLKRLKKVESPDTTFVGEEFPIVFKKAQGLQVIDADGQRFTDLTACFGVLAFGHRPAPTLRAIRNQSSQLLHAMGDVHPSDAKVRFLEKLARVSPYPNPRIILSNTGFTQALMIQFKRNITADTKDICHRFSVLPHHIFPIIHY